MRQRLSARCLGFLGLASLACGAPPRAPGSQQQQQPPPPGPAGYGLVLKSVGGTYNDGSGRLGVATLMTLRDKTGAGPASPWALSVGNSEGTIASLSYDDSAVGSFLSWWSAKSAAAWNDEYRVLASDPAGDKLSAAFILADSPGLAVPLLDLAPDGSMLKWQAVDGALSYECRVYSANALVTSASTSSTQCDLSALPAGGLSASVLAMSADLVALGRDSAQEPALPAAFDVSEGRLAFVRGPGGAVKARASGGTLRFGGSAPGLALWLSITNADGSPTTVPWSVSVSGPGIDPSAPLSATYVATMPRAMFWSYEVAPQQGNYAFTATSTAGTVSGGIAVGTPAALDIPGSVAVDVQGSGEVNVSWAAVAGAKSYFVSVWTSDTPPAFTVGQWVNGTSARFPKGTFSAGSAYAAYVAATNVDMVGGTVPTQVTVSEDTYSPVSFTGR